MQYLTLEPSMILRGQVWRILTWVVCVSPNTNIFWVFISLYFYYSIGRTLENVWGAYRYNVYMFSGLIFTVLGAFIMYGILIAMGNEYMAYSLGTLFTTYYVCMSIFLAFAATFPEMEVLLLFVLPIKVKVLGIFYVVIMVVDCFSSRLILAGPIIASLLNFIIFFFGTRNFKRISPEEIKRKAAFRNAVNEARHSTGGTGFTADGRKVITKHKCAICGRTELDGDELEFRFCSKCNGNYEYCNNHLFTHKHVE